MKNKVKTIIIYVVAFVLVLVLLVVVLRCTHVIVKIGDNYYFAFSEELALHTDDNVNDDNISEIKYMTGLKKLAIMDTEVTNLEFLSNFNKLESVTLGSRSHNTYGLTSLSRCEKLRYVTLVNISIEDMDAFSGLDSLSILMVTSKYNKITDISGLNGIENLYWLSVINADCDDYSVLLTLPNLSMLSIPKGELTEKEVEDLLKRGVDVTENKSMVIPSEKSPNSATQTFFP